MKNSVKEYYENKYYENSKISPPHYQILKIVELLSYKNGKSLKILDIGCGSGVLGQHLKKKGHSVFGVEISEKAGNKAKKVLDDVVIGDIEEIELPWCKNYFDVVILADVLEHLFDPEKVLIKLKEYLKENGIIIISLPNICNWEIRIKILLGKFKYQKYGILDYGHIRFFNYYTALSLFRSLNFKILNVIPIANLNNILVKLLYRLTPWCINLWAYQIIFILTIGEEKCIIKK